MRVVVTSHKNSNATTVVLPTGTVAIDDTTGHMYIHDGSTPGGNLVSTGSSPSNPVQNASAIINSIIFG